MKRILILIVILITFHWSASSYATLICEELIEKSVFFDSDSHNLSEEAQNIITKALEEVSSCNLKIQLEGHSSLPGSEQFNLKLSQLRVDAVKKFLENNLGFSAELIKSSFYGSDKAKPLRDSEYRKVSIFINTSKKNNKVDSLVNESNEYGDESVSTIISEKSQKANFIRQHRYHFLGEVYHNLLTAKDVGSGSEAEWVSKENLGLEGVYQLTFSQNFWLGAKVGLHFQDYLDQNNPAYSWDKKVDTLLKVSIASDYEWERLGVGLDLDYSNEHFIYEEQNLIQLRKISMFGPSFRLKYNWYAGENWSSNGNIKVEYHFTGESEIDSKGQLGFIGAIDVVRRQIFGTHDLLMQFYYGQRNYDNNQNDQTEEITGLRFGIRSDNWL